MLERMHPEDLRAIVTATMWGREMTMPSALKMADLLLADLVRTAKPEAPAIGTWEGLQSKIAERRRNG